MLAILEIAWVNLGETDNQGVELLRLDVTINGELVGTECTLVPSSATQEELEVGLEVAAGLLSIGAGLGLPLHLAIEQLSYLNLDDLR